MKDLEQAINDYIPNEDILEELSEVLAWQESPAQENGREKTASVAQLHWQEQTLNLQQYEQEKANYHRCAVEWQLQQRTGEYEHARLIEYEQQLREAGYDEKTIAHLVLEAVK